MKGKGMTEDAPITDVVNRTIAEVSKQGGGTVVIPEENGNRPVLY